MFQHGMVDDPRNRFQPNGPFPDLCVSVFVRSGRIGGIVEMNGTQAVYTDAPVKLAQNPIGIADDVIPGIAD